MSETSNRDPGSDAGPYRATLAISYVILLGVVVAAMLLDRRVWAVDAIVLGAGLAGVSALRRLLNLTPVLFAAVCSVVVIHGLGVFGLFRLTVLGYEWDTYVHTYSLVVAALVAFRYVLRFERSLAETVLVAMLLALGLALANELIEFAGYRLFGRGEGLFLLGPGDIGATDAFENLMTDFFHGFFGAVIGLGIGVMLTRTKRWP
jgi:hypothetical protein